MAETEADKQAALDEINDVLRTGIRREAASGNSTEFAHETIATERERLERELGINQLPTIFRFRRS